MKVYLSGPMTGFPDLNYPKFHKWESVLREKGYDVYNPAVNPKNETYANCMKLCLPEVLKCDVVAVMDGWTRSRGSRIEVAIAVSADIPIVRVETMERCEEAYATDFFAIERLEYSQEAIARVFDKLYKVANDHENDKKAEGVRLGLDLAQQVIEHHLDPDLKRNKGKSP